jgi:hypothetical protein
MLDLAHAASHALIFFNVLVQGRQRSCPSAHHDVDKACQATSNLAKSKDRPEGKVKAEYRFDANMARSDMLKRKLPGMGPA